MERASLVAFLGTTPSENQWEPRSLKLWRAPANRSLFIRSLVQMTGLAPLRQGSLGAFGAASKADNAGLLHRTLNAFILKRSFDHRHMAGGYLCCGQVTKCG